MWGGGRAVCDTSFSEYIRYLSKQTVVDILFEPAESLHPLLKQTLYWAREELVADYVRAFWSSWLQRRN